MLTNFSYERELIPFLLQRAKVGGGEGENLLFPNTILFGHDSWMEKQTEGRVRRSVPTVMLREFIYVHSAGSVLYTQFEPWFGHFYSILIVQFSSVPFRFVRSSLLVQFWPFSSSSLLLLVQFCLSNSACLGVAQLCSVQ
jgi:hypothetical protein